MDEIERRIRDARPLSRHRHMPLPPRAEAELQGLLSSSVDQDTSGSQQETTSQPPTKKVMIGLAAAVAVLMIVASLQLLPGHSPSAEAATPPPLEVRQIEGTAEDWLEQLADSAEQRRYVIASPNEPQVVSESWSLSTSINDNGEVELYEVLPEQTEITYHEDDSVTMVVRAGEPFSDDLNVDQDLDPGEVLMDTTLQPEELMQLHHGPVPNDSNAIEAYLLSAYLDRDGPLSAGEAIEEITILMNEQALEPEQEAALLQYLAGLPDMSLMGETTDRLEREGIAFQAQAAGDAEHEHILVVSPQGEILATELQYTGSSRPYLDSPTVVEYYAWKKEPFA